MSRPVASLPCRGTREGGWVLSAWEEALILSVVIIRASQALLMKSPSLFREQVWSDCEVRKPHFMQVKRLAHDLPAERKGSSAGSPPQPLCLQAPRALPVLFCRLRPRRLSQMRRHRGPLALVRSWLVAGAGGVGIREAGQRCGEKRFQSGLTARGSRVGLSTIYLPSVACGTGGAQEGGRRWAMQVPIPPPAPHRLCPQTAGVASSGLILCALWLPRPLLSTLLRFELILKVLKLQIPAVCDLFPHTMF